MSPLPCPECGEVVLDCQCSLADGPCIQVDGSGNLVPASFQPVLDPDAKNIYTKEVDGHLVKLPLLIRIPPACQAYNSANQSIPDDDGTPLALNSERYDNGGLHDTVTNNSRITFIDSGVYIVTFQCSWAGNAVGDREAWIRKNGKDHLGKAAKPTLASASLETGHSLIVQEFFEAGEYVEGIVKQDSGGALNILATRYSPILAVRRRRGDPRV